MGAWSKVTTQADMCGLPGFDSMVILYICCPAGRGIFFFFGGGRGAIRVKPTIRYVLFDVYAVPKMCKDCKIPREHSVPKSAKYCQH